MIGRGAVFKAVVLAHQVLCQTSIYVRLVLLKRVAALPYANLTGCGAWAHLEHGGRVILLDLPADSGDHLFAFRLAGGG